MLVRPMVSVNAALARPDSVDTLKAHRSALPVLR
jgi:hypothetical protein